MESIAHCRSRTSKAVELSMMASPTKDDGKDSAQIKLNTEGGPFLHFTSSCSSHLFWICPPVCTIWWMVPTWSHVADWTVGVEPAHQSHHQGGGALLAARVGQVVWSQGWWIWISWDSGMRLVGAPAFRSTDQVRGGEVGGGRAAATGWLVWGLFFSSVCYLI